MRGERSGHALVVGLLTAVVAFVAVVQVRSQAEVVRSLEGQDNASLAFLIDDLHRANDRLLEQAGALAVQRDALRAGEGSASAELEADARRLRLVNGLIPARGPGVVISVDAPLTAIDLQDAVNNLRVAGAEAVAVNDHRVITGSVVRQTGQQVSIDGAGERGPWTLSAIGQLEELAPAAEAMTRSLRADPRVGSVSYRVEGDLPIRATVAPRPLVYGSS